ncbi:hypothetical protein [Nonomuraea salmonea]|uniref:hypothetical protein n=1 Tax=Nonomuraea salmonea TaxID=46181 RepID=UPI0031EFD47A
MQAVIVVLGAAQIGLFYAAHRAVTAAKRRGKWYEGTRQATAADTTLRTDPERVPWRLLIPPVLLLLITAAVGSTRYAALPETLATLRGWGVDAVTRVPTTPATAFAPVLSQLALTLLTPLLVAALLRARPDLDAAHPPKGRPAATASTCAACPASCWPAWPARTSPCCSSPCRCGRPCRPARS